MRSLRRLSVLSIVPLSAILVLCPASARAQTASSPSIASASSQDAAQFAAQIAPPLSSSQSAPQLPPPSTTFRLPPLSANTIHRLETLDAQQLSLLARNDGPCYALRTYGFTAGHDPAEAPRLSSHTTCTPASKSHLRELVKTPSSSSH